MQDIKSIIKNLGPVSISAFMQEIMFNPSKGYYKTKNPIGSQKDFITAPEISSIFSQLIAGYFFSIFAQQKPDQKMVFVEMGAGLGTMFCDILKTFLTLSNKTEDGSQILKNINLAIIEKNPVLTKIQQEKLTSLNLEIFWFNNFEDFENSNKDRQIYFTCNELFDCFSINQFSKSNDQWREILVDLDKNENIIPYPTIAVLSLGARFAIEATAPAVIIGAIAASKIEVFPAKLYQSKIIQIQNER